MATLFDYKRALTGYYPGSTAYRQQALSSVYCSTDTTFAFYTLRRAFIRSRFTRAQSTEWTRCGWSHNTERVNFETKFNLDIDEIFSPRPSRRAAARSVAGRIRTATGALPGTSSSRAASAVPDC